MGAALSILAPLAPLRGEGLGVRGLLLKKVELRAYCRKPLAALALVAVSEGIPMENKKRCSNRCWPILQR